MQEGRKPVGAEFTCGPVTTFRQQPSLAIPSQPTTDDIKPGQGTNGLFPG